MNMMGEPSPMEQACGLDGYDVFRRSLSDPYVDARTQKLRTYIVKQHVRHDPATLRGMITARINEDRLAWIDFMGAVNGHLP